MQKSNVYVNLIRNPVGVSAIAILAGIGLTWAVGYIPQTHSLLDRKPYQAIGAQRLRESFLNGYSMIIPNGCA